MAPATQWHHHHHHHALKKHGRLPIMMPSPGKGSARSIRLYSCTRIAILITLMVIFALIVTLLGYQNALIIHLFSSIDRMEERSRGESIMAKEGGGRKSGGGTGVRNRRDSTAATQRQPLQYDTNGRVYEWYRELRKKNAEIVVDYDGEAYAQSLKDALIMLWRRRRHQKGEVYDEKETSSMIANNNYAGDASSMFYRAVMLRAAHDPSLILRAAADNNDAFSQKSSPTTTTTFSQVPPRWILRSSEVHSSSSSSAPLDVEANTTTTEEVEMQQTRMRDIDEQEVTLPAPLNTSMSRADIVGSSSSSGSDEEGTTPSHDDLLRLPQPPKIAFLFLSRGPMPLEELWQLFFTDVSPEYYSIHMHVTDGFQYTKTGGEGLNAKEEDGGPGGGRGGSGSSSSSQQQSHVKEASTTTVNIFLGKEISARALVAWGTISLIDAERNLIRSALKDPRNQRFVLASESCAPLRPFSAVYHYLMSSSKSFMESFLVDIPGRYDPMMAPTINRTQFRKGGQWFALRRDHAHLVANEQKVYDEFAQHCIWDWGLGRMCAADETYIQTTLAIYGREMELEPRGVTFTEWYPPRRVHPKAFVVQEAARPLLHDLMSRRSIWSPSVEPAKRRNAPRPPEIESEIAAMGTWWDGGGEGRLLDGERRGSEILGGGQLRDEEHVVCRNEGLEMPKGLSASITWGPDGIAPLENPPEAIIVAPKRTQIESSPPSPPPASMCWLFARKFTYKSGQRLLRYAHRLGIGDVERACGKVPLSAEAAATAAATTNVGDENTPIRSSDACLLMAWLQEPLVVEVD